MLLQLASAASALLLAPAAPQVGLAMLPCSRRCAVQCSETAEYDVVVIGSGVGGLSAAAAAASTGLSVAVLESHDAPGGAAHEWTVKGFHFESGPSLYAGLSPEASPNPLKHVFQIIGEEPEWLTYDRWGTYLPDGDFAAAVGADDFVAKLQTYGGPDAKAQARRSSVRGTKGSSLTTAPSSTGCPAAHAVGTADGADPAAWRRDLRAAERGGAPHRHARCSSAPICADLPADLRRSQVRADAGVLLTMGRFAPALGRVLIAGGSSLQVRSPSISPRPRLGRIRPRPPSRPISHAISLRLAPTPPQEPFSKILDEEGVTDPFIRNWLDMICFLLQATAAAGGRPRPHLGLISP